MEEEPKAEPKTEPKAPEPKESYHRTITPNLRRVLALEFAVVGVVMGAISFLINSDPNARLISLVIAVILGIVNTYAIKLAIKPHDGKWWASPIAIYVGMWIVVWTILFNLYVVRPF